MYITSPYTLDRKPYIFPASPYKGRSICLGCRGLNDGVIGVHNVRWGFRGFTFYVPEYLSIMEIQMELKIENGTATGSVKGMV